MSMSRELSSGGHVFSNMGARTRNNEYERSSFKKSKNQSSIDRTLRARAVFLTRE